MQETQIQSLGQEDPRRRKRQLTPILLSGESQEQRSLAPYGPQGHKDSDTAEQLSPVGEASEISECFTQEKCT